MEENTENGDEDNAIECVQLPKESSDVPEKSQQEQKPVTLGGLMLKWMQQFRKVMAELSADVLDDLPPPRKLKGFLKKDDLKKVEILELDTGDVSMNDIPDLYECYRPISPEGVPLNKQGSIGFLSKLSSNYFAISPTLHRKDVRLFEYKVEFNPVEDTLDDQLKRLNIHKEFLGPIIFNGTSMYSYKKYSPKNFELRSKWNTKDKDSVIITGKIVSEIEFNEFLKIRVFNSLFYKCMDNLNLTQFGQIYCDPVAQVYIPKYHMELWPGYHINVARSDHDQMLLRVETVKEIVHDKNVMEFYTECVRKHGNNSMESFKAHMIGLVVLTYYNDRTYKIIDVAADKFIDSILTKKDGTKISYRDYFQQKYQIVYRYNAVQPLLVTERKKLSGEVDLIHLIPELCSFTGLSKFKQDNLQYNTFLKNNLTLEPRQHVTAYKSIVDRLNSSSVNATALSRWNLILNNKLVEVVCRVLPPELIFSSNLFYNHEYRFSWLRNTSYLPMLRCVKVKHWIILTPFSFKSRVEKFLTNIQKAARSMSYLMPDPVMVTTTDSHVNTFMAALEEIVSEKNPSLIVCAFASGCQKLYTAIKRKLCVELAIPSQIVLIETVDKADMAISTKFVVEFNCKLGGAPWYVKITEEKLMAVGIVVYRNAKRPGITYGALVASMNNTHTSYFSCSQQCMSEEELSQYFTESITKALFKYKSKNGELPINILIYRDGATDGQTPYIYATEIPMIKDALKNVYKEIMPRMAFVLVNTHSTTKFFFMNEGDPTNPIAGTVIDSVVTDKNMFDFYLISQYVKINSGTAIPTYYVVLEDTAFNWCANTIQLITYQFTHMYFGSMNTVDVPAPCKYAEQLARFTAETLEKPANPGLEDLLYYL